MTIPNLGRGGLPVYSPTGATLTVANGTRAAAFTGTTLVATNPTTGALEYAAGVGDHLVVSGVGAALIESITDATNLVLAEHWDYPTQSSITAQGTPGWYIIRNSVPAFGSNAKAINDLLAKGSDSSPDQSRTIDNGAARMKLRINASGVPEIAVGAAGAADAALLPSIRIDPATGTVTFPNSTIGGGGGGSGTPIRLHAGTDTDPDTVETIDNGTSRVKIRVSSIGQIELAAGASGASDASLFTAIRINPANGQISFPAGGSVAGMTGTGGGGGGGTFTGTGDPGLTRAQAMVTNFTSPPNSLRTIGYDTPDDLGGGLYVKETAEPNHEGKFKTADNTWYGLRPELGKVWAAQFGGKKTTVWNARDNDLSPALNKAVDFINFSPFGGCDLWIHPGTYYMASTVQLKGNFNVRGTSKGAVFIMPEAYVTGFVGHHPIYSFEDFGGVYYGNRDVIVGETVFGSALGTNTYICTVAGRTSADGSQKPTGTGNNQLDGTVRFNYYRQATRVEMLTSYWVGEFSHITLYSHFDGSAMSGTGPHKPQTVAPAVGPWNQALSGTAYSVGPWKPSFGFLGRGRSHVHHCDMFGFSAHGCAYMASGDFDFPTVSGNVDYWCVTHCAFYYNVMDGLHASYSDGNAGYAAHIDLASNGRWGVRDQSFLGNCYVQLQSAYDGRSSSNYQKRFPASVAHNGYYYHAKLGRIGAGGMPDWGATAPTPGASNYAWAFVGGDGTWASDDWMYPTYVPGGQYEPSGCYAADNLNARNVWIQCYIEGGTWPAQFNGRDLVLGGLLQGLYIGTGDLLFNDGAFYSGLSYRSRSRDFGVQLGGSATYTGAGESIITWTDGDRNQEYGLRSDTYEAGQTFATSNWAWAINRGIYGYWLKSGQTTKYYGRGSPVDGGAFAFHRLFIGSDGNCRQLDYADSIPASDQGGQGDRVYNRLANVGQPEGWMKTASAWRPLPNLQ